MRTPVVTLDRTSRPPPGSAMAVVGAGLSGLVCARRLVEHGHRVRLFDKARAPGGRMSTRRAGELRFDHGAQYFTVRDRDFRRAVDSWRRDGVVERWRGRIAVLEGGGRRAEAGDAERFVGIPGMSALCRHLAADLDVSLETPVDALARDADGWSLVGADGAELGRYDSVVVSAPAPQTAALLAPVAPRLAAAAAGVEMTPCWAAMVAFGEPIEAGFDAAFVNGPVLSWVARDSSKPSRPTGEAWVLHGSPDWTRRHLELDRAEAAERLLAAFGEALGAALGAPFHLDAHRWRFALPQPLAEPCLFDSGLRLAACGDWCGGPRVEGAFLSGRAAAGRLLLPRPEQA